MKIQNFLIELSCLLDKYGYYELDMKFFDGVENWTLYQNSNNKIVAENEIDVFVEPCKTEDLLIGNENSFYEFNNYEEFIDEDEDEDYIY